MLTALYMDDKDTFSDAEPSAGLRLADAEPSVGLRLADAEPLTLVCETHAWQKCQY